MTSSASKAPGSLNRVSGLGPQLPAAEVPHKYFRIISLYRIYKKRNEQQRHA